MDDMEGAVVPLSKLLELDSRQFLQAAYWAVLGRAPDPSGLEYYLSRLEAGVSTAEVFDQLCRSREAKALGIKLHGSSWFTRKLRSVGRAVASSSPRQGLDKVTVPLNLVAHLGEPARPADENVQLIDHLGEELKQLRGISEGLVNAVQGLQQVTGRHEQALAAIHASAGQKSAAENEVVTGLGLAVRSFESVLKRHEQDLAALHASAGHKSAVENEVVTGLGLAVRSFESVLKRHEKAFVFLRSDLSGRIDGEVERIQSELGVLSRETLAQAKTQAELERGEARLGSGLAELQEELQALASLVAARREQDTAQDPALAAFEKELERIAEIVRSSGSSSGMMGLKIDVLDQKSHWLSVDNDNIRKRIEFVRKEIMFELRRVMSQTKLREIPISSGHVPGNVYPDNQRIKPFEFVAGEPKRVNLGCGHLVHDGFANLDARDLPGVDIVADLRRLPFDPSSIDELRATHVIEHFTEHALLTEVLPHWASVLRPGGTLMVTAPDSRAMIAQMVAGTIEWETAKTVLLGGQEYEGDFHFALLDPAIVCSMLELSGFSTTQVVAEARPNGDCLEFEVIATR